MTDNICEVPPLQSAPWARLSGAPKDFSYLSQSDTGSVAVLPGPDVLNPRKGCWRLNSFRRPYRDRWPDLALSGASEVALGHGLADRLLGLCGDVPSASAKGGKRTLLCTSYRSSSGDLRSCVMVDYARRRFGEGQADHVWNENLEEHPVHASSRVFSKAETIGRPATCDELDIEAGAVGAYGDCPSGVLATAGPS